MAPPEEVRKGGDERGSDRQPKTQSSDSETEDDCFASLFKLYHHYLRRYLFVHSFDVYCNARISKILT